MRAPYTAHPEFARQVGELTPVAEVLLSLFKSDGTEDSQTPDFTATGERGEWLWDGEKLVYVQVPADVQRIHGASYIYKGIKKTEGANAWGNAGAHTTETYTGDFELELKIGLHRLMVGLSTAPNLNYNSIDYAWYIQSNLVPQVYEAGYNRGNTSTIVFDSSVLAIKKTGTLIEYFIDGALEYTSTVPATAPMHVSVAFFDVGAQVSEASITQDGIKTAVVFQNRTGAGDAGEVQYTDYLYLESKGATMEGAGENLNKILDISTFNNNNGTTLFDPAQDVMSTTHADTNLYALIPSTVNGTHRIEDTRSRSVTPNSRCTSSWLIKEGAETRVAITNQYWSASYATGYARHYMVNLATGEVVSNYNVSDGHEETHTVTGLGDGEYILTFSTNNPDYNGDPIVLLGAQLRLAEPNAEGLGSLDFAGDGVTPYIYVGWWQFEESPVPTSYTKDVRAADNTYKIPLADIPFPDEEGALQFVAEFSHNWDDLPVSNDTLLGVTGSAVNGLLYRRNTAVAGVVSSYDGSSVAFSDAIILSKDTPYTFKLTWKTGGDFVLYVDDVEVARNTYDGSWNPATYLQFLKGYTYLTRIKDFYLLDKENGTFPVQTGSPANALTLNGQVLTLNGQALTL